MQFSDNAESELRQYQSVNLLLARRTFYNNAPTYDIHLLISMFDVESFSDSCNYASLL